MFLWLSLCWRVQFVAGLKDDYMMTIVFFAALNENSYANVYFGVKTCPKMSKIKSMYLVVAFKLVKWILLKEVMNFPFFIILYCNNTVTVTL